MELVISQIINGISGSAELFLVAIGLVITFGMLDVVNMAHGELIMLGSYIGCVFVNTLMKLAQLKQYNVRKNR